MTPWPSRGRPDEGHPDEQRRDQRRAEELLLAQISEAAGRERIGRRVATYPEVSCPVDRPVSPRLTGWMGGIAGAGLTAAAALRLTGAVPIGELIALVAVVPVGLPVFAWMMHRHQRASASTDARLDLYEHGLTVALRGKIHVVRYATATLSRQLVELELTDVAGGRIALRPSDATRGRVRREPASGEFRDADDWAPVIEQAIANAQPETR